LPQSWLFSKHPGQRVLGEKQHDTTSQQSQEKGQGCFISDGTFIIEVGRGVLKKLKNCIVEIWFQFGLLFFFSC
jgi:hypothetical protein